MQRPTQRQTQKPINFSVNYLSDMIARRARQMQRRERVSLLVRRFDEEHDRETNERSIRMSEENARTKLLVTLGGIGVVTQLLFLRWSVFRGEVNAGSFVNNYYVTGTTCLSAAFFYALFLRYPVTWSIRARSISLFALCTGALGGAMATTLAFQVRYLMSACFLTYTMQRGGPEGSVRIAFELALLNIETYALVELLYMTIPAFLCGTLVAALVAQAFIHSSGGPVAHPSTPANERR